MAPTLATSSVATMNGRNGPTRSPDLGGERQGEQLEIAELLPHLVREPLGPIQVLDERADACFGPTAHRRPELLQVVIEDQHVAGTVRIRVERFAQSSVDTAVLDHGVMTVRFNRPHRHNAWSLALENDYFAALDAAAADERVRAVVVTGAGTSFCPGVDVEQLKDEAAGGESTSKAVGRCSPHGYAQSDGRGHQRRVRRSRPAASVLL